MNCQVLFDEAVRLHQQGELLKAENLYRRILEQDETFADAWNALGVLAQQMNMLDVSVDLIGKAIDLQSQVADYYFNIANSYHGLQQIELEEKALLATLELAPSRVDAHIHLGALYEKARNFSRAAQIYQEALLNDRNQWSIRLSLANCYLELADTKNAELEALAVLVTQPNHRYAQMLLSRALLGQKRYPAAISLLEKMVIVDPDFEVTQRLACARKENGDFALAAEQFEKLIKAVTPAKAGVHVDSCHTGFRRCDKTEDDSLYANLGACYFKLGKFVEATQAYEQAVNLKNNPDYYSMLGAIAQRETRWEDAKKYFLQALAIDPNHDLVLNNFANLCIQQRDFEQAFSLYDRAIAVNPACTDYHLNLGVAYYESNQFAKAIEQYRLVLANKKAGEGRSAHNNLAMVLLLTQSFEEGWQEHNYRPAKIEILSQHPHVSFAFSLPEDLTGKRILLWAEQGIGDELFFMRFAPLLQQRGASLICQATTKILPLVRRFSCFDEVIERSERVSADVEIFLGDLPMLLQCNSAQAMPPPLPITALTAEVTKMRERLAKAGSPPYIGLTWRGGTALKRQQYLVGGACAHREIDLSVFASGIQPLQGTLIALQRLPEEGEIAALEAMLGRPVLDCSDLNEDVEGMLALLHLLDHYIAVPNTHVYLRCSLGKNSQVMLNARAGWSWLAEVSTSFWYPHCDLHRATVHDDWTKAFAQCRSTIARLSS